MKWTKERIPMIVNGQIGADMYDGIIDDSIDTKVLNCGGGYSESVSEQFIMHWNIAMFDGQSMVEPTYKQKVQILKELGIWKKVALEVMPPEVKVVDRADVYHIWEFEYPYSFMCDITPIYSDPKHFEGAYEGIDYHIYTKGGIIYVYFKPHNILDIVSWRRKQNLKNFIIGPNATAVEIVHEQMLDKKYSCLIGLPVNQTLDFGLK